MNKKMIKICKKEVVLVTVFFTLLVFGILTICGTITSGIHLVDDHEFWTFSNMMKLDNNSIWEVIDFKMGGDFKWRFRPLYYPIRIIQTVVFGTNLFAMSILKAIEVVVACVLIYLVARKLNSSVFYSIITVFVILVGPQSATWWKLGPQELTGTWIFALGILCLFEWKQQKKTIFNAGAIFLFTFVSLYKESFIAMIPAVMLIYIYLSMENKKVTWKNLGIAVKENLISELILAFVLLAEAYIILFVIGTNEVDYIGINPDLNIGYYIKVFLNNFRLHLRVGQYGIWVLALFIIFRKKICSILKETKSQFLLACVMVLPQFLLYAKSGIEERYIIPWIYGVAYYFVIVLSKSECFEGSKKKCYTGLVISLLIINFILVFYEATYFSYRGKGVTNMFNVVVENADEDTKVLTAFAPYDESYHTSVAVLKREGIENVYIYRDECINWYNENEVVPMEEIDIVLMYNDKDRHYLYEADVDLSDFEITDYNTVRVAIRKQK